MKHSILIISFALSLSSAFSQTMPMQISVEIGNAVNSKRIRGECGLAQVNNFPIVVMQKIDVSAINKDSLTFRLKYQSFGSIFGAKDLFQNLTVWAKSQAQDTVPINYSFSGIPETVDGQIIFSETFLAGTAITVFLDENIKQIMIRYNYTSDYFNRCRRFCFDDERYRIGALLYFQPQIYAWHSWHFTHPLTELTHLQFLLPDDDSYIFFATQTERIIDNLYVTDLDRVEIEHGINFFLLKRELYEEISFYNEYVTGRFLLPKGHTIDTEKITRETKYFLAQLNDFFDNENHISFHKVGADLRLADGPDGAFIWGNVTFTADGAAWILSDLSEINPIHHHEVIHLFFDDDLVEGDIAPFFFRESMIEYLAIFFANRHDAARRDSVFNARFAIYQGIERESLDATSIFDVEHNFYRMDGSLGGTSAIVYLRTPFKVHQLAKSVGEENFFNILRTFYHHVKREQRAGFADFEKILKQNGVTDEQWLEFVTNL